MPDFRHKFWTLIVAPNCSNYRVDHNKPWEMKVSSPKIWVIIPKNAGNVGSHGARIHHPHRVAGPSIEVKVVHIHRAYKNM